MPDLLGPPELHPAEPLEVAVEVGTEVPLPGEVPPRLLVEAAASAPRALHVRPEDDASPEVRLDPGTPLAVRVRDEAGQPVEGAEVVVHAADDGLRIVRRGRTLEDGGAEVRDLPAGPVEVYARAPGGHGRWWRRRRRGGATPSS